MNASTAEISRCGQTMELEDPGMAMASGWVWVWVGSGLSVRGAMGEHARNGTGEAADKVGGKRGEEREVATWKSTTINCYS